MRKKQEWNGKMNREKGSQIYSKSSRYADSLYMSSQKSTQSEEFQNLRKVNFGAFFYYQFTLLEKLFYTNCHGYKIRARQGLSNSLKHFSGPKNCTNRGPLVHIIDLRKTKTTYYNANNDVWPGPQLCLCSTYVEELQLGMYHNLQIF